MATSSDKPAKDAPEKAAAAKPAAPKAKVSGKSKEKAKPKARDKSTSKAKEKATQRKSPLQLVNEQHGSKAKLLESLSGFLTEDLWLGRTRDDRSSKDEDRKSTSKDLARVSNAKLARLHRIFTEVKKEFGSREKLIGSILEAENKVKDEGYKKRLSTFPVPRLLDCYKSAKKRAKAAGK